MAAGTCANCKVDAGLWEGPEGQPLCGDCCSKLLPPELPFRSWSGHPAEDVIRWNREYIEKRKAKV